MISYDVRLAEALNTVLPAHYELFVNDKTVTPCITYMPYDNADEQVGDTIEYANVMYMIKVWGERKADLEDYSLKVHRVMREHGFLRVSTNELFANRMGQKIMLYQGTSYNKL